MGSNDWHGESVGFGNDRHWADSGSRSVTGVGSSYDIAVSFAGAQRPIVELVVRACQCLGLNVFYDKDRTVEFWGRNFVYTMRAIYSGARARYFVPFLSNEYLASDFPMDEFKAATRRAIAVGGDSYILPIVVGPVKVPVALLSPAIGRLRLEDYSVGELARIIAQRVGAPQERSQKPRDVSGVADEIFQTGLSRLPPSDFSPYLALEKALAKLEDGFQRAAGKLSVFGVLCIVRRSESAVNVRIERQGMPVCGLRLSLGSVRDDRIVMTVVWSRAMSKRADGWAIAEWDPEARQSRLRYVDLASGGAGALVTEDELFALLWAKIIDHVAAGP